MSKGIEGRAKKAKSLSGKQWFILVAVGLILLTGAGYKVASYMDDYSTDKEVSAQAENSSFSTVALVQAEKDSANDLTYEDIKALVSAAVGMTGGFKDRIRDGDSVVIKPNLVQRFDFTLPHWRGRLLEPEVNGVTTDWRVIKALVELVREVNPTGEVLVMEGSAGPTTKENMKHLKYTPVYIPGVTEFIGIEDDSGGWHEYNSPRLVKVDQPKGLLHKVYYLNKRYKEADFVITVPTLKNHWHAGVSGGVKNVGIGATPANIYGISPYNPGRNNMVNHEDRGGDLHKWIHDFYLCRPVDFVVMDGLQGIQNGPTPSFEMSGTADLKEDQMNMRLILAGSDAVAVDTIESLLVGWDPFSIRHLVLLNQSGAGNIDPAKITVVGEKVSAVRKDFAGGIPRAGGEKISDKIGPQIDVKATEYQNGDLKVSLGVGEETVKVDLYIDGKLINTLTEDFSRIIVKKELFTPGESEIKIIGYDRFLNETELIVRIEESSVKQTAGYKAPQAAEVPRIDGKATDDCWKDASWRVIDQLWLGERPTPEDFSGRYKVVWSPENLYFLVEITDDLLSDKYKNPKDNYYKDDCLEIFIDEDKSGGDHTYNFNAFAYHISVSYDIADTCSEGVILLNDHARIKRTKDGSKYTWEVALKVFDDTFDPAGSNTPVTLTAGKTLGFALAYCDNDGGYDRESFMGSIRIPGEDKNVAWQDAGVFDTMELAP